MHVHSVASVFDSRPILNGTARQTLRSSRTVLLAVGLLLFVFIGVNAQTTTPTDGFTPSALTPGAPTGSYPLNGFANVNLYNGNLNFALPLLKVGARGEAAVPMMLTVEQHWQVKTVKATAHCELTDTCDLRYPSPGLWGTIRPGYGPGIMQGRHTGVPCNGTTGGGRSML